MKKVKQIAPLIALILLVIPLITCGQCTPSENPPVNHSPVLDAIGNKTVNEGQPLLSPSQLLT